MTALFGWLQALMIGQEMVGVPLSVKGKWPRPIFRRANGVLLMLTAVNDYILQFTDVQQDNLFRGYRNRSTLPSTQDYTMYYMAGNARIGTNVDEINDFKTKVNSYREYIVNIDFCGENQAFPPRKPKSKNGCGQAVRRAFFSSRRLLVIIT